MQPMRALSKVKQALINHVVFVLDGSYSMTSWRNELVSVTDDLVGFLAKRSTELDQETRVTVYIFGDNSVWCVFYDKDVLRMPSIKDHYRPDGGTPLLDATLTALDELDLTARLHGDHADLIYVLTDGEENRSRAGAQSRLEVRLRTLPEDRTVGILVPDQRGRGFAERFGFPRDNIAIWEPTSAAGVVRGGQTIQAATESFMTGRSMGVRSTRTLFSTGVDAVNKATVSTLTPLAPTQYTLVHVTRDCPIKEWVEQDCGLTYHLGTAFYELKRAVNIQPQKQVAVVEKKTKRVYSGPQARAIIGLPDIQVRVKPDQNPDFSIFIQSTSVNRKLFAGDDLLLINR